MWFFEGSWFSNETWILLATIIVLITVYCRRKLGVLKRLNVPHDNPGILGLNYVIQMTKDPDYTFFKDDIEMRKKHGDVYGRYQFLNPIITVWDPEILKAIYVKEFNSFPDRQQSLIKINGEMNEALTSIRGHQWKRVRSTMTPAFSSSKLKEMLYIADNCADILMNKLEDIAVNKDGVFEPREDLGRFTLDVISSAAFSANFKIQEGDDLPRVVQLMKNAVSADVMKDPAVVIASIFPSVEWIFEWMDYSIFTREFRKHLCGLTDAIINSKKKGKVFSRTDLMQQMLANEISEEEAKTATKGFTRKEIIGNSFIMILVGYETTAQALTYLFYNLAQHQHVQDRLRSEIQEAVDRHDGKINYEMINDVKYMMQCINESLRYYAVVPMNMRMCDHEVTIKGLKIPKGASIQVPICGLHHSEDHWDEPSVFNPDRMEDMTKVDPMVFQPFGGGPRNCIGMRFALMVMKLVICRILTNYRIVVCEKTPAPPLELTITLTTTSKENIFLKLEKL